MLVVFDSSEVPPFPGQTKILSTSVDWESFQARACSRPPLPMMRIVSGAMSRGRRARRELGRRRVQTF